MGLTVLSRLALCLFISPLLPGVIARTKAFFAGRQGPPLLQFYYDIFKLLRKGSVYSRTTTWVFRAAPPVTLAAALAASLLIPLGGVEAPMVFWGDALVFVYLFGLARFFTVLAAWDTGSSLEGMGASREAAFSCVSEVALFLNFAALAVLSKSFSLTGMIGQTLLPVWAAAGPSLVLVVISTFMILLVENARVPVDDPATHLELTMIHEVMVLDHGGPDLGLIYYASSVKFFVLGGFLVTILVPFQSSRPGADLAVFLGALAALGVVIGVVESTMARLRLGHVFSYIVAAFVLASFGLIMALSRVPA